MTDHQFPIKRARTTVAFLAIFLLAAGCNFLGRSEPPAKPVPTTTEAQGARTLGQVSFAYSGIKGQDAMSLLKVHFKVETEDFGKGLGEFVKAINGVKPAANEFWAFYVNDKSSTVGASSYATRDTDQIEWRLEKIN